VSALGVVIPVFMVRSQGPLVKACLETLRCISVGLILGVTLLHLLPDAVETMEVVDEYPFGFFFCGVGICLQLFLEQVSEHLTESKDCSSQKTRNLRLEMLLHLPLPRVRARNAATRNGEAASSIPITVNPIRTTKPA
jgi:hypothetical protein